MQAVANPKTFTQVLTEVQDSTMAKQPLDRWGSLNKFEFLPIEENNKVVKTTLKPMSDPETKQPLVALPTLELSDYALGQLLQRVDYSQKLITRLPAKAIWFDVNWLMQNVGEREALIRTINGNMARAILGSRYTPLDDVELYAIVAPYVRGALVRWESITDVSSHISISWPDTDENGLQRGIHIANSEVGLRAVSIRAILYKDMCNNIVPAGGYDEVYTRKNPFSNGKAHDLKGAQKAVSESGWRFIHTGDKERLQNFVRDAIEDSKAQYEGLLARYNAGLQRTVDGIGVIVEFGKKQDLSQAQLRSVLEAYAQDYDPKKNTVTGVAMAFTAAAQHEQDAEERYHMQAVGSEVLKVYLN